MCGRYYIDIDNEEMKRIITAVENNLQNVVARGEIFPTNTAPIMVNTNGSAGYTAAHWGFPKFKGQGVLINARAESVEEKPTFSKAFRESRCIVPATGFFEWTQHKPKQKYIFRNQAAPLLFMAGLLRIFEHEQRFVIMTTAANASVSSIHNRMPVIISAEMIAPWLSDVDAARAIINGQMPMLQSTVC